MMRHLLGVVLATLIAGPAWATSYSFKVPEKLVNIVFESRMEVEDIFGTANVIDGSLTLDAKGAGSFQLEVPVSALKTGIAMRDEHLRSPMWFDVAKHPLIRYSGKGVRKLGGDRYEVSGDLELRGKKRPLKVVVEARQIPKATAAKLGLGNEGWVRLRGEFAVKLSGHGVRIPKMAAAKVSDLWTVKVSLFAREVP